MTWTGFFFTVVHIMATSLSSVLRYNPDLVNANCYLFALAPKVGLGGYAKRPHKAQPGEKCFKGNVPPLPFSNTEKTRSELIQRVTCDNPASVKFLKSPYESSILTRARIGESEGKRHLMACIFGSSDFHFLRRMYLSVILKSLDKLQPMSDTQLEKLREGQRQGKKFIWVHQRGWMPPEKGPITRLRTIMRRRMGMRDTGFGSPTVFDAKGNPCWSCVPESAPEANPQFGYFTSKPEQSNFSYPGLKYDHFCGFFVVDSGRAKVYSGRNTALNTSMLSAENRKNIVKSKRTSNLKQRNSKR